ncbi:MAG TPA: response regulator [Acidimicrobiales bacterium]|nr:response regulator [Acidimicrobiales bacterium]
MADIVVATDSPAVFDQFRSVLDVAGSTVRWVQRGQDVSPSLNERPADLVILDMQIGNMGALAVAADIRMEAEAGRLEPAACLVVLDRRADVFLARRTRVDGWIIKPLDPIRIRRAAAALLAGRRWEDPSYLPQPVNAGSDVG